MADTGCWWEVSGRDEPQFGSPPRELFQVAAWASSQMATGFQAQAFQETKAEAAAL